MPTLEWQIRYAYLVTLVGVLLASITTVYTGIRSFLFSQSFRSRPASAAGNFTRTQFGNFTRPYEFGRVNPYGGGFINYVAITAVIIAIIGIVWLGISLRSRPKV